MDKLIVRCDASMCKHWGQDSTTRKGYCHLAGTLELDDMGICRSATPLTEADTGPLKMRDIEPMTCRCGTFVGEPNTLCADCKEE